MIEALHINIQGWLGEGLGFEPQVLKKLLNFYTEQNPSGEKTPAARLKGLRTLLRSNTPENKARRVYTLYESQLEGEC